VYKIDEVCRLVFDVPLEYIQVVTVIEEVRAWGGHEAAPFILFG